MTPTEDDAREFDTGLRPEEVDPGRPRPVATPWGEFSLFRLGDGLVAVQSFCPHMGGPIFQGTRSEDSITCPWHLWRFSLRTGERLDAGRAGGGALGRLAICPGRRGAAGTWLLARPDRIPREPGA